MDPPVIKCVSTCLGSIRGPGDVLAAIKIDNDDLYRLTLSSKGSNQYYKALREAQAPLEIHTETPNELGCNLCCAPIGKNAERELVLEWHSRTENTHSGRYMRLSNTFQDFT